MWVCRSEECTLQKIVTEKSRCRLEGVKSAQSRMWPLSSTPTPPSPSPIQLAPWPWESFRMRPRWRESWGGGCPQAGRWASSWPRWDARRCGSGWPSQLWSACCRTGLVSSRSAARGTARAASRSRCPLPPASPASPACGHGRNQRLKSPDYWDQRL